MNRREVISRLRAELVKRRNALRRVFAGDLSLLETPHATPVDKPVDSGLLGSEISFGLAEAESCELARIENALETMQTGKYGVCENCKVEIPLIRLKALPSATLCIKCQREAEKGADHAVNVDWSKLLLLETSSPDREVLIDDVELDAT